MGIPAFDIRHHANSLATSVIPLLFQVSYFGVNK